MDVVTRDKWDRAAPGFDLMASYGPEKRWEPAKRKLFSNMGDGEILFLAVGTGLDVRFFPEGRKIVGIDISQKMLDQAAERTSKYVGDLTLQQVDVHDMPFEEAQFDQVFTSCTFCSVPNPVVGLEALRKVLKPGGDLFMFEHTGSRYFPFKLMMDLMTLLEILCNAMPSNTSGLNFSPSREKGKGVQVSGSLKFLSLAWARFNILITNTW